MLAELPENHYSDQDKQTIYFAYYFGEQARKTGSLAGETFTEQQRSFNKFQAVVGLSQSLTRLKFLYYFENKNNLTRRWFGNNAFDIVRHSKHLAVIQGINDTCSVLFGKSMVENIHGTAQDSPFFLVHSDN